ncbi:hypothetical protein JN12_01568 [Geobacter argillaceus]|uniref:Uncharacterized protein n=2 Tax=Geobacter argillaceus TaxID=345631 RepID=A0A562VP54_9BACT|nr:hypothetical protein JN12_01568 [Geobacter argillaceus]
MTAITPTIRLMTSLLAQGAGMQIEALILEYNGSNFHLHGGTRDKIHVFIQGICLYVLTINTAVGYVGLNTYMAPEPDAINTIFLYSPGEIKETLGAKWEQLPPESIVRRLIRYLI